MTNEIKGGGTGAELSADINVITAEINAYQRVAGEAIFEIGRRLKHVKENDLSHGKWERWIKEDAKMSPGNARKFIKVAEELTTKRSTSNDVGLEALYQIATLPESSRDQAFNDDGSAKTVRELRDVKRQLKAEQAERERLEIEAETLADKPPEVRYETKTPDDYEEMRQENELFRQVYGDPTLYEGGTSKVSNGDAVTYTVFEFSEDVRKFVEKYGHLTHFTKEFKAMISEGKTEYRDAVRSMYTLLAEMDRNLDDEEVVIIDQ